MDRRPGLGVRSGGYGLGLRRPQIRSGFTNQIWDVYVGMWVRVTVTAKAGVGTKAGVGVRGKVSVSDRRALNIHQMTPS